jgi:uncharacterized protein
MSKDYISKTIDFVKTTLEGAEGGHDWFHIERVWNNTKLISQTENVDREVVELAALLHDIADSKFHDGDETLGPKIAKTYLQNLDLSKDRIDHIVKIIENISFKGGNHNTAFDSPEFRVVQDADRLDAIGAVGISRCFNFGGFKNRSIYNPDIPPKMDMTKEEYKNSTAPSINHFYEKLLLLKDSMHTSSGREIAIERHRFMELFLEHFFAEWQGKQ